MFNFTYDLPTKILFGKDQIENLGQEIKKYTDSVLLVYGGGSIKKNGSYDAAVRQLNEYGIRFEELAGVAPNPRIESVIEGVDIIRENDLKGILAVGGGSSIDCAKVIAGSVDYQGDPWDLVSGKAKYKSVLPIFTVLTLSATGSEMDRNAVISNTKLNAKLGTFHPDFLPKVSVLDPTYTFTVPNNQTAAGTADIMSHIMESYFSVDESAFISDRFAESLLKACIKYAPIALTKPDDYEARANLMWASTLGINGITSMGKKVPWSVHRIEHMLSAYYDITHGTGLAILTPHWMEYVLNETTLPRFVTFGINVWNIDASLPKEQIAKTAIAKTRAFFSSIGIPEKLGELGIDDTYLDEMAVRSHGPNGLPNAFMPITVEDIRNIIKNSL